MRPYLPLALIGLTLLGAPSRAAGNDDIASLEAEGTAGDHPAHSGGATVESRISASFTQWAGSADNAAALVSGLRDGTPVNLLSTAPDGSLDITAFTPATGPMGYGNVRISLALAQAQLAGLGIVHPTPGQLVAALNGGPITYVGPDGALASTTLRGVLELRASGMGWGEIAQAYGTKLGPVISGLKSTHGPGAGLLGATPAGAGTAAAPALHGRPKGASTGTGKASPAGGAHAYGKGIVTAYGVGEGAVADAKLGKGRAYGLEARADSPISTASGAGASAANGQGGSGGKAFGHSKAPGKN